MELTKEDKNAIGNHPVYLQEEDARIRDFAIALAIPEYQLPDSTEAFGMSITKGGMAFQGVIRDEDPFEPYLDITPVGQEDPPHCVVPMEELHDPFLARMPLGDILRYKVEEAIDQAFLEGKLDPKELQVYDCLPEYQNDYKDYYDHLLKDLRDAAIHPDEHASGEELGHFETDRMELALVHVNLNDPECGRRAIDASLILKGPRCHVDASFTLPARGIMECRNGEMLRSFLESQITAASHRNEGFGITHDFLSPRNLLQEDEQKKIASDVIEARVTKLLDRFEEEFHLKPDEAMKLLTASVKKIQKETGKQSSGR